MRQYQSIDSEIVMGKDVFQWLTALFTAPTAAALSKTKHFRYVCVSVE